MIRHNIYVYITVLGLFYSFTGTVTAAEQAVKKNMQEQNGSFEADGGWILKKHDGADGKIEYVNNGRNGSKALKISKTNARGFLQIVCTKPVQIKANKNYIFRGYYQCKDSMLDSLLMFRITRKIDEKAFPYNSIDRGMGLQSQQTIVNSNPGEWAKRIATYKKAEDVEVYKNIILAGNPVTVLLSDVEIRYPDFKRITKPFVSRTTYPYTKEQVLEELKKRKPVEACIEKVNDKTRLVLNGKPVIPIIYKSEPYDAEMAANRYTEFGEAHVSFATRCVPLSASKNEPGIVIAPGKYDFKRVENYLIHTLRQNPKANIIVFYNIREPFKGWEKGHMDSVWQNKEGKYGFGFWGNIEGYVNNLNEVKNIPRGRSLLRRGWEPWYVPSYSSKFYQDTHIKSLQDITRYIMNSPYGKAVAGFGIVGGHDGQFQYSSPDYSQAGTNAFRDFLRNKYAIIANLNEKLKSNYSSFDKIKIPSYIKIEEDPRPFTAGILAEYKIFIAKESWKVKTIFANAVRDVVDKKIFIASYGNPPYFHTDILCAEKRGVDLSADQGSYAMRRPGFPIGWKLSSSYGLHGKMGLWELDLRTWTYPQQTELREEFLGIATTPKLWQSVNRKFVGMALADNGAAWYYSMNRYFDHPDIMEEIAKTTKAAQRVLDAEESTFRPDVCVIRSELSDAYITARASVVREAPNTSTQMTQLEISGVPYDLYSLDDVLNNPELQNYKMYVFYHVSYITKAQRRQIKEKLAKKDTTLFYMYSTGYIDENGKNIQNMRDLTGFTVTTKDEYNRAVPLLSKANKLTRGINRMFSIGELENCKLALRGKSKYAARYQLFRIIPGAGQTVLANYQNWKGVAMAMRISPEKCRIIYSAAPQSLSAGLMNRLAIASGAFIIGKPGQSVHMNGNFLSFHGVIPGKYTIILPPGVSKIVDPFTGKMLAGNVKTYTFDVKVGKSLWFLFEKAQN